MELVDIVNAIIITERIPSKDIEETVLFLTKDTSLLEVCALRRIAKRLNAMMKYEDASVS